MFKLRRLIDCVKVFGKKNSAEILLVVGFGAGVATVVTACRSTIKAQEVLEDHAIQMSQVHRAAKKGEAGELDYTAEDKKKDTVIVYTKTAVRLAKEYAIPFTLGVVSVSCVLVSFGIMRKRYLGMVALYTSLDKTFKSYRKRVIEKHGEDADREFMGMTVSKVVTSKLNDKGEIVVEEKEVPVFDPNGVSPYSRIFYGSDEADKYGFPGNPNYITNYPEANKHFLDQKQKYWNQVLKEVRSVKDPKTGKRKGGWVFLSEVYQSLGFPPSQASQEVGWIYDEENPIGDNFIDFGMYRNDRSSWEFINEVEDAILLDFNVDGYILDKAGLAKF